MRKVDKTYNFSESSAQEKAPTVIDKINALDEKIEHPESLKFSFSRQKYVEEVKKFKKIYLYAVSRSIAEKVIERLDLNAEITRNLDDADIVIAHKNFIKGGAKVLSTAEENRLQIFYVKTNSMAQIQKVIKDALDIAEVNDRQTFYDITEKALDEANKMNNMVKKLLSLNQLEFGNNFVEFSRFDITAVISSVLLSTDILMKQKEITVHFENTEPVFILFIHSANNIIITKTDNDNNATEPSKLDGILNKLLSNIPLIHADNVFKPVARNIIHPNTANAKVKSICPASFSDGNHFVLIVPSGKVTVATVSRYRRFLPNNNSGTNNNAWYAPHNTNVQFAPCQKPLSRKIIKVLRTAIAFLYLSHLR